jgi:hypothetical protein
MPTLLVENVPHTKVVSMIDVSRLQRLKVDMTPPADLRTEDEKVVANVKGELEEKFPWYKGGICVDVMKGRNWSEKTFLEKCQAIYLDTVSYM